jgi:hypothetical protein
MELKLSNIWAEAGATVSGIGIACATAGPMLSGQMPTTAAGWIIFVAGMAMAVVKALGK